MSIFDKFKKSTTASRQFEEQLYAVVATELKAGIRRDGLWLMALEKGKGNEEKAKSHYISLRIQSLIDETNKTLVEQAERVLQEKIVAEKEAEKEYEVRAQAEVEKAERVLQEKIVAEKEAEKEYAIRAQADFESEERRLMQLLDESIIILQDKGFKIRALNHGWAVTSPKEQKKIIYEIEFLHDYANAQ